MVEKENKKLILLESSKIFISLQFLKAEETECLTDYGKGLLGGLLDPDTEHKIPVVHRDEYNKLLNKCNKLEACEIDNTDNYKERFRLIGEIDELNQDVRKLKETIDKLRAKKSWWRFWE